MYLGWTRNVAILERCGSNEERTWYIRAVLHFGWKKAKLLAAMYLRSFEVRCRTSLLTVLCLAHFIYGG